MIISNPKDAFHKVWLYRTLSALYDDPFLAGCLYFKGGTCASMRGFLDRFSVDLDFDLVADAGQVDIVRSKMEAVFKELGLEIKDKSKNTAQYFLRYPAREDGRNTLKIDVTLPPPKANVYESVRLIEIDRIITCQNVETMFANKMVALIDRYEKNESIAGRDIYDIHHFFLQGFDYNKNVIIERRNKPVVGFLEELILFIEKNITMTILEQDLNSLLPYERFSKIRKILKQETLMLLKNELERIKRSEKI